MSEESNSTVSFQDLGLGEPLLLALKDLGYETPSPIQAATIPPLREGQDVLGQAQTGTGKTAAFALPLLENLDLGLTRPQVMVLVPTRELAIQVAEAFQRYAHHLPSFHVLPIYGGQDYRGQLRQLQRGVHVVVGTPGRVMDHMRRGSLDLGGLSALVLDEADEMLRMGFIDDVEWILEQTPDERQVALFSATMPAAIKRIAETHLRDPRLIAIKLRTTTAETIRQRYWMVSGLHKLDALTRILEAEPFDGMIVFVRTKVATEDLAERLQARGFASEALNGDIPQKQREQIVERLKGGRLDILVATDVAARGLDVQRISHVVNYDIPHDPEGYVHRVGRTGRAGRSGEAILFVAPRERRMLHTIERVTGGRIEPMDLPTTEFINDRRIELFKQRIIKALETTDDSEDYNLFLQIVEQVQQEHNVPALEIAAALAGMAQGDRPLLLDKQAERPPRQETRDRPRRRDERGRPERPPREKRHSRDDRPRGEHPAGRERGSERPPSRPEEGMARYRMDVGREHGANPGQIVGAIANESGLDSQYIGRIQIHDQFSTVDLPEGMPKDVERILKKVWVAGKQLGLRLDRGPRREEGESRDGAGRGRGAPPRGSGRPRGGKPADRGRPSKPHTKGKRGGHRDH